MIYDQIGVFLIWFLQAIALLMRSTVFKGGVTFKKFLSCWNSKEQF